ncbi:E3 ubiquitin-protein ligase Siah1-like isoform X2 [Haemaphysalis longicornis]
MSRQPAGGGSGGKSEDRDLVSASALASLFVCPVCRDYVQPPILQCFQGHIVCSACCRKLFTCPICRTPLSGTIRNLAMENVARMVFFPCKYSRMGCTAQLPHSDQHEHEEVCEFSPEAEAHEAEPFFDWFMDCMRNPAAVVLEFLWWLFPWGR